jgi:exodeoxyribonuclease V alpha subunit
LETIRGFVRKIIFHSEESGFKVMRVQTQGGPFVTITGEFGPEIVCGTIADFHGDYKKHHKYGSNFRASSFTITHNIEELKSIELFIDAISPNIGNERARAIVRYFGSETIKILDNEPARLIEVEGIGKISANSLSEAWKENRERWKRERQDYTLRAFLNSLGIKERKVKRILNHFGGGLIAEEKIKENPYILTEIVGFGFSTADFIGRKLGISINEPIRLIAFIQYALNELCPSNGHLFLTLEEILTHINNFCIENNTTFLNKRTITIDDITKHLKDLIDNGKIIKDMGSLYSQKCYLSEVLSASKICEVINKESDLILLDKDSITKHIKDFELLNNLTLSDEQRRALYYFVDKKVYVITGLPGTGKTLILRAIVSLIKKLKLHLTCMAPTGISAKKMATTIGHEAYTIHRRLGFRGDSWNYGENNKYETDVVLLDEASMIDQEVFYRLLSALKSRVHLIFVGDNHQLPSVGAGNVLRELIECKVIPIIRLEHIFRQDKASDIIKVAHKIKNGDIDLSLFKSDPKADVFFIRENNTFKIQDFLVKIATKFKKEKRLFQIITPRNEGPLSVNELNDCLQEALNPPGLEDECVIGKFIIRRGDRVIIIKNDYELDVYNGEVGKIIQIGGGRFTVEFDEKTVVMGIEEALEKMKLAYSLTVHRSQGQEYPFIILPFVKEFGKNMLQRNLLYTAITRAKKKVIIIGHGSAIEKAINNASVHKRNTNLGERIKSCLLQKKKKNFLQILHGELADSPNVT